MSRKRMSGDGSGCIDSLPGIGEHVSAQLARVILIIVASYGFGVGGEGEGDASTAVFGVTFSKGPSLAATPERGR
jgi:hypothetical protein